MSDQDDSAQRFSLLELDIDRPAPPPPVAEPVEVAPPIEIDRCSGCGCFGTMLCMRCRLGAGPDDVIDHLLVDAPVAAPPAVASDIGARIAAAVAELRACLGAAIYISLSETEQSVAAILAAGGRRERAWYNAERRSYFCTQVYFDDCNVATTGEALYGPPPPDELDNSRRIYPGAWAEPTQEAA